MNNIVVALKSDIAKIIYVMVIIVCCFLVPNMIGRCSVPEPIIADNTQHIIDSVNQVHRDKERAKLDSIDKVTEKKLSVLKTQISVRDKKIVALKEYTETLIDAYENDPDLAKCDSVVNSQQKIISEQDSLIEDIGAEAEHYSNMLYSSKQKLVYVEVDKAEIVKQLKLKDATIEDLYKQLTKNQKRYKFCKGVMQVFIIAESIVMLVK